MIRARATGQAERLSLTSFVIGPESQGRGYRLLAPDKLSFVGARDLAMILMEWSRVGERDFAACLKLPGAERHSVVFRARHGGREALGQAAFLNGVLVTSAHLAAIGHRTELILPHIDVPDGSARFAGAPLELPLSGEPLPFRRWDGLGLAWQDRHIIADSDERREALLVEALASIDPPEQRARVAGWVTSARLVSRGALHPLRQCQLIVSGPSSPEEVAGHLRCIVTATGAEGAAVDPPESWTSWLRFQEQFLAAPRFAPLKSALRWQPGYGPLSARDTVEEVLRIATGVLPLDEMVDLLVQVLAAGEPYEAAAPPVVADYLQALDAPGAASALRRLLLAPRLPIALTSNLLRFAGGDALSGLAPKDLAAPLEAAREAIRAGALVHDPQSRLGLIMLMRKVLDTVEKQPEHAQILSEIVDAWPEEFKADLLALTSPETFGMIFSKSRALAAKLALSTLRRKRYGVRARGGLAVGLRDTVRAIALYRAESRE